MIPRIWKPASACNTLTMKRLPIILLAGLLVPAAAYCAVYFKSTAHHREVLESQQPELAWLRNEFQLNDAEFKRITELHEAYMPHCTEMCRRLEWVQEKTFLPRYGMIKGN